MKVYQANCIEHGERFIALFKTVETNKNKLKQYGQDIANGWNAECISVKLIKHNNHTYNGKTIDLIYNYDEKEL